MPNANEFTVVITALDKATSTLHSIKEHLSETLSDAPVVKLGHSLASLAAETGLPSLVEHAFSAAKSITYLGGRIIGDVLKPLGLIGGASAGLGILAGGAGIAGIFELARGAAEAGARLEEASEKTGVAVGSLAQLHYVAKQSGLDIEQMDNALEYLNRSIGQAASGRNKIALAYFRAMHVEIGGGKKPLMDAGRLFGILADKFSKNHSIAIKTTVAMQLFGRAGKQLLPVLDLGAEGVERLRREFDELHGPFTRATGVVAKEAIENWRRLDEATLGLRDAIGYALSPVLTPIISGLTKWIAKNRELIAGDIGGWAKDFSTWLKSIDWSAARKDAITFAKDVRLAFKDLVDVLEDLKGVYEWLRARTPAQMARQQQMAQNIGLLPTPPSETWKHPRSNYAAPSSTGAPYVSPWSAHRPIVQRSRQQESGIDQNRPLDQNIERPNVVRRPDVFGAFFRREDAEDRGGIFGNALSAAREKIELGNLHLVIDFNNAPAGVRLDVNEKPKNSDYELNVLNTGLAWNSGY